MPDNTPPQLEIEGALATITLNRPRYRNRLHNEDLRRLLEYFEKIERTPEVRVVVLTANTSGQENPVFCAGFHVGEFDGNEPVVPFEQVPDALENLRAITLCAMPGSVYGGATDMALACDFRLGVEGMELRMPAAALGLHYYPTGLVRYVSRLGVASAKKAFLTACHWTDQELLRIGYLDTLCSVGALPGVTKAWVGQIELLAPLAVAGMKRSLNDLSRTGATFDNLQAIRRREAECAGSSDFAEGRLAFAEKRKPRFEGR